MKNIIKLWVNRNYHVYAWIMININMIYVIIYSTWISLYFISGIMVLFQQMIETHEPSTEIQDSMGIFDSIYHSVVSVKNYIVSFFTSTTEHESMNHQKAATPAEQQTTTKVAAPTQKTSFFTSVKETISSFFSWLFGYDSSPEKDQKPQTNHTNSSKETIPTLNQEKQITNTITIKKEATTITPPSENIPVPNTTLSNNPIEESNTLTTAVVSQPVEDQSIKSIPIQPIDASSHVENHIISVEPNFSDLDKRLDAILESKITFDYLINNQIKDILNFIDDQINKIDTILAEKNTNSEKYENHQQLLYTKRTNYYTLRRIRFKEEEIQLIKNIDTYTVDNKDIIQKVLCKVKQLKICTLLFDDVQINKITKLENQLEGCFTNKPVIPQTINNDLQKTASQPSTITTSQDEKTLETTNNAMADVQNKLNETIEFNKKCEQFVLNKMTFKSFYTEKDEQILIQIYKELFEFEQIIKESHENNYHIEFKKWETQISEKLGEIQALERMIFSDAEKQMIKNLPHVNENQTKLILSVSKKIDGFNKCTLHFSQKDMNEIKSIQDQLKKIIEQKTSISNDIKITPIQQINASSHVDELTNRLNAMLESKIKFDYLMSTKNEDIITLIQSKEDDLNEKIQELTDRLTFEEARKKEKEITKLVTRITLREEQSESLKQMLFTDEEKQLIQNIDTYTVNNINKMCKENDKDSMKKVIETLFSASNKMERVEESTMLFCKDDMNKITNIKNQLECANNNIKNYYKETLIKSKELAILKKQ